MNNGKDGKQIDENFDDEGDSETSSDEEELTRQIAAVKKMIQRASAVLRGEDGCVDNLQIAFEDAGFD